MPPKAEKEAWNDEHTLKVIRGLIHYSLTHRSEIYQLGGLEGVNENGGDRINKKIQQILKKLCDNYPGSQGMVEDEIKFLGRGKSKSITGGSPSPKKNGNTSKSPKKNGETNGATKKRKVKEEEDDEDEDVEI